jgi:hypothetical protein
MKRRIEVKIVVNHMQTYLMKKIRSLSRRLQMGVRHVGEGTPTLSDVSSVVQ